ncbi:metallophosphoesterase family protein [Natranaerobius thermophilus]|uniref:Metallophosphoesterase n=1 Tax=Natranaerobius thermophilus (strain ATCC BAA-1301 / DSM 18059 / JW/NM-WN-LF) TaxID=457570 RepID=B2A352_NATTJ|nr:metallophosphoesterase [Natranaerobius thermophilus]ACB85055.1 metallophosphoesterase [Natranaerobius thermophilus JW/NM-WN-LF]
MNNPTRKKTSIYLKLFLITTFVGLLFVTFLSPSTYNLGPFMVELRLQLLDHGLTTVDISPVGEISARTHLPPVKLLIDLESMDLDQLSDIIATAPQEELVEEIESQVYSIIRSFVTKLLVLSVIGGFVGAIIGGFRTPKYLLTGVGFAVLVTGILMAMTFGTYDIMAFENPEFDGALQAFPWMMGVVEDSLRALDDVSAQLQALSENLFTFFQRIEELQGFDFIEGEYQILHISDIHNNPASYDLVDRMVASFGIDMIIDTGDITDYGSPIEAELASEVSRLPVPYVLIPGNHDSPQVIQRLREIDNVYVVEDQAILEILDFKIAGIADPASESTAMEVPSEEVLDDYAKRLAETVEESGEQPDIIGAHHPHIARQLELAPTILTGHTHLPEVEIVENDDPILVSNAGTTGAAGIRGIEAGGDIPYSLVVLHFNADKQPIAADLIKVRHLESGYRVERFVVEEYLR